MPANLAESISAGVKNLVSKAGPSVCRIEAEDEHGRVAGTGFLLDADGTVVTSYSMGSAAKELMVMIGEDTYPARRLLADARSGISLIKVETNEPLPFLKNGSGAKLAMGTPLVALGYPLNLPLSPSFGIVAGFDSGFRGRYFATRHIRVNAAIQRGEGGAPLLDLDGKVVGVLISAVDGESGLFALPIEAVGKIQRDYETHGRVRPGWLGADVRITDAPEHGSTARLRNVRVDGPGFKGQLRPGDVLLQVGDWKITSPEDVLNASFFMTAEEPVSIRISRAGKVHTFSVTPGDPPEGEFPKASSRASDYAGAEGELKLGD
jgi:serine protease Do